MQLFKGRPKDESTRSNREIRVYDLLDSLKIDYERVDHKEAKTMEACDEIDKILGTKMCKNLFLCNRQKTAFYLLMMPGDKPFKTKVLSQILSISRLSFASEEYMLEFLDIKPGSVSVMGLMNDKDTRVQLIIDKCVIDSENFGCHPCENTSSLKIKSSDLVEKILPAIHHKPIIISLPQSID